MKTKEKTITSDYVKYNKNNGTLIIKENVLAKDNKNNLIETNYAEYDEKNKIFKTVGPAKIITTDKYVINGKNIILDNDKRIIYSKEKSVIQDQENNFIYLQNFEYIIEKNIFKSIGLIKIKDKNDNSYEFSQIYIDTKKKEILGTDIKTFFNQNDFKIDKRNKPRVFANTIKINQIK